MGGAGVTRGWSEKSAIRLAGVDGMLHGVINLEDDPLGAVLAKLCFVLALDDGEGFHDVVHVVTGNAVEVEEAASSSQRSKKRRSESQRKGGPSQPQSLAKGSRSQAV